VRSLLQSPYPPGKMAVSQGPLSLMLHNQNYRFWRVVAQCLSGSIALALVTFVCFRLQLNLAATACLYLIIVVLLSLQGSFLSSAVVSFLGVGCLAYYFAPPIFSFRVSDPLNLVAIIAFWTTSAVITRLVSRARKLAEGALSDIEDRKRAEVALRNSEEQWKNVFENNPTMYFMVDPGGTILSVNPFGAEQLGYTVEELVGHSVLDVFCEEDREPVQKNVALCLKHLGKSMSWELRKVRKDGSVVCVRETARAVLRANDPVLLIACEDITERKRAEEKVREQEVELRQVLDLTPQHVAVLRPDRSRLYVNRAALDYHGVTLEEWRSSDCLTHEEWRNSGPHRFFHPDDWDRMASETRSKFLSGSPHETEGRLLRKDGVYRWFLFRYNPMRDEEGRVTRWYVAATDIEDRKQAEAALREQARLLNLTHDSIFVHDMDFVITYWNLGAEELYGWTAGQAVGKVSHQLLRTVFPAALEEIRAELLHTGRWEGELVRTKADGTKVVVASRWSLQRDERQQPLAVLETNNDVTERRRAEEALRQAQADLEHVNRVITMGELTASLAHEIKQPIAAAVTNASTCLRWLAADTPNHEEARAAAMRIVKDGTRAGEIISGIRLLFKKSIPQRELMDVNEVIREIIVLLRSEAMRYSISIRTKLAADLPQVLGDRVQLQQVLMNLMVNSIEAMKDVDGTRELNINSQQAENEHLLVSVSDTGVGLPPQQADQIFNAFFTTKPQGTGMGLRISRSIIESHGGRLWAADNSSRGASFYLSLPAQNRGTE
jgi:two-component system sensor kinase FixL